MKRIRLAVGATMLVDGLLYLALFPLLPIFAEQYDLSKVEAALLLSGYQVAFVATAIPAGWLAGRLGARTVVVGGLICFVAASALFAVAPTFGVLIAARMLQGVAGGCGWSAAMSWLTENTAADQRSRAIGLISGISSAGAVAGPALGAFAAATTVLLAFSLIAVIGAVAMVLALLAPAGRRAPPDPPLVATVRQLLHHPAMIMALCFAFCVSVTISTVDLLAVLELGNRGIGATMIGLAFSFGAVLGVGFGALAGRLADRFGNFGLCLAGSVGLVAICLVLAAPLPNWALIGALIAMGPLFPLMMTGIYPLIAATSDELGLSHGTANGFVNICWSTTFGVMPLIAAQIAEWDGDDAAYLAAAATTAVLAVIAVLMRSRARNLSLSH